LAPSEAVSGPPRSEPSGSRGEWVEARVTLAPESVETAEEVLTAAGASAVTVTAAEDVPNFDPGAIWPSNEVVGLFAAEALPADLETRLSLALGDTVRVERVAVPDQEWAEVWKARFAPRRIGNRLWIRPSWDPAPVPESYRVPLELDPGMAFGTGHHETTLLCLEWLDANIHPEQPKDLLDYGCGSGLLAIAALKLGADWAAGLDNDPLALEATRANAAENEVGDRLEAGREWGELSHSGPFDGVIANILANTLVELADDLIAATRVGGDLVLSGILTHQVQEVRAAFEPSIHWRVTTTLGDWVRLDGIREV
jgi:ribosomal protein L11 methyltransferase